MRKLFLNLFVIVFFLSSTLSFAQPERPAFEHRISGKVIELALNYQRGCSWLLDRSQKLPNVVGAPIRLAARSTEELVAWLTFIKPIGRALQNPDKVRFLGEIANAGIKVSVVAALIKNVFFEVGVDKIAAKLFAGDVIAGLYDILPKDPLNDLVQPYLTYQFINAARTGIGLQEHYTPQQRIYFNIALSTYFYGITEIFFKYYAGKAALDPHWAATSFVSTFVWALFSEVVRQKVTHPYFYFWFPRSSVEAEILKVNSTTEYVQSIDERITASENQLKGLDPVKEKSARKNLKDEILSLKGAKFWGQWLRKDLKDGEQISKKRLTRMKWIKDKLQTALGVGMLVGYILVVKKYFVGEEEAPGVVYQSLGFAQDIARFSKEILMPDFDPDTVMETQSALDQMQNDANFGTDPE